MAYSDEGHGVVIEEIGVWLAHQTEITVTGTRFLQEDSADEIGRAIASFVRTHRSGALLPA